MYRQLSDAQLARRKAAQRDAVPSLDLLSAEKLELMREYAQHHIKKLISNELRRRQRR